MHNAAERHIVRQLLQECLPRLALLHIYGFSDNFRAFLHLRVIAAGQHDRLVSRREFCCEFCRRASLVCSQNPRASLLCHHRWPLRHDHALIQHPGEIGLIYSQDFYFLKAHIAERPSPHHRPGEGVVRAETVGKSPPAVQLSESQVHPTQTAKVLESN